METGAYAGAMGGGGDSTIMGHLMHHSVHKQRPIFSLVCMDVFQKLRVPQVVNICVLQAGTFCFSFNIAKPHSALVQKLRVLDSVLYRVIHFYFLLTPTHMTVVLKIRTALSHTQPHKLQFMQVT
jgi:hypothetical protein